jgi:YHS domain-containing protein
MIRFFVIRFLLPLLILFLVRSIFSGIFASLRSRSSSPARSHQPPPTVSTGGELKKDPVCGTYVAAGGSLTRTVNGQLVYFCSQQCRDKYRVA